MPWTTSTFGICSATGGRGSDNRPGVFMFLHPLPKRRPHKMSDEFFTAGFTAGLIFSGDALHRAALQASCVDARSDQFPIALAYCQFSYQFLYLLHLALVRDQRDVVGLDDDGIAQPDDGDGGAEFCARVVNDVPRRIHVI